MKIGKFELKKPELSFSDLDGPYQNHFIKEYVLLSLGFIIAVVFCILVKQYWYILGCIGLGGGYAIYLYSIIYKSLTGKVSILDLKCTDLVRKETSLFGMKDAGSKTCTLLLQSEEGLTFTQSVAFASTYKTGNIVRIYASEGSISQINRNTYTVINPIFMHVLAT